MRNDMFIDELTEFIDSVNLGKISPISITESMMSVDIALKALK